MTDEPDREGPVAGPGWLVSGLEDDIRPHMFAAAERGEPFALATIVAADGGPRPVGAQGPAPAPAGPSRWSALQWKI